MLLVQSNYAKPISDKTKSNYSECLNILLIIPNSCACVLCKVFVLQKCVAKEVDLEKP